MPCLSRIHQTHGSKPPLSSRSNLPQQSVRNWQVPTDQPVEDRFGSLGHLDGYIGRCHPVHEQLPGGDRLGVLDDESCPFNLWQICRLFYVSHDALIPPRTAVYR